MPTPGMYVECFLEMALECSSCFPKLMGNGGLLLFEAREDLFDLGSCKEAARLEEAAPLEKAAALEGPAPFDELATVEGVALERLEPPCESFRALRLWDPSPVLEASTFCEVLCFDDALETFKPAEPFELPALFELQDACEAFGIF